MQNIISLDHNDIDTAIAEYITSQGVSLEGKTIDIKITSGRGANAVNVGTVTVSKKEVSKSTVKDKSAEKEPTEDSGTEEKEESETSTIEEEKEETDDQPPITKETVVVDDEPKDEKSLFG